MLTVLPINAYQDNYIWCIQNPLSQACIVVDPGEAQPVIDHLEKHQLTLVAILVTHHHYDHVDGICDLVSYTQQQTGKSIDVYGPLNPKIKQITHPLKHGDVLTILGTLYEVTEVPGHTLDHLSYFSPEDSLHSAPWLFCGDTLFSAGCGRLFEGTPAQMLNSLKALASYPLETEVYCTHEYTLSNLAFTQAVLPNDTEVKLYIERCQTLRDSNKPTLPSTIKTELAINPFLNCTRPDVQASVSLQSQSPITDELDTFTRLRKWKDTF
ncbi:hydroxyacylglutathione hydrolase [Alkalimarinus alittae]|uniref:Hydroxyacylglutathione hydrolase n=1 Tax=Alkalimarinus alittae TaxID=2961619 RepID=A0ABY6N711_9ALTE|nr:hydroxyacylglutathione hydrolase [Alkalimarinus alittae]UZE97881.1 hydroxyacylglutathione hydrolase [Alkalimarinus alittae]